MREHNLNASLAWHIAAMSRAKKLPRLRELLVGPRDKPKPQSWQQMKKIAELLTVAHGGTVKKKN